PKFASYGPQDLANFGIGTLDDSALRLWIEHEPRADAPALPDGARARAGAARRLAFHHHPRRLCVAGIRSGCACARGAVAAYPARPRGAQCLRAARLSEKDRSGA